MYCNKLKYINLVFLVHTAPAPYSILTGAGTVIDSKAVYLTGVGANFESEAKNFFVILFLGSLTLVY